MASWLLCNRTTPEMAVSSVLQSDDQIPFLWVCNLFWFPTATARLTLIFAKINGTECIYSFPFSKINTIPHATAEKETPDWVQHCIRVSESHCADIRLNREIRMNFNLKAHKAADSEFLRIFFFFMILHILLSLTWMWCLCMAHFNKQFDMFDITKLKRVSRHKKLH